ncbi:MAG: DUF2520 domain-containing protein [Candidatus Marinimicrobia bacterium]|nr:DUF2520 domain-containing protein [Candidatus Neomarinimicrobiota bacterium]
MNQIAAPIKIALLGPGRVGRPLVAAMQLAGYAVEVFTRGSIDTGKHRNLAGFQLAFLTLPDQEIPVISGQIKQFPGEGLIHCSGQVSNRMLGPRSAMFHPLMSFRGDEEADVFTGCPIGISGAGELVNRLQKIADAIGALPFVLEEEHKASYHLAAMFASVFPYTLLLKAKELAVKSGIAPGQAGRIFGPIFRRALDHLEQTGAGQGMTGPVSRGDGQTLQEHMTLLADSPEDIALYKALTRLSIQYANLEHDIEAKLLGIIE